MGHAPRSGTNVLGRVIPGLPALTSFIMKPADSHPLESTFESTIERQLGALMRLCQEHGARLVVVVPPTTGETYGHRIHTIAGRLGLAVVVAGGKVFDVVRGGATTAARRLTARPDAGELPADPAIRAADLITPWQVR
jgi:hypothetical protein